MLRTGRFLEARRLRYFLKGICKIDYVSAPSPHAGNADG